MRFALIGQPNCGKSTLFNQVAGYKAETGNFSGTTVTYTATKVRVMGEVIELVDLPGTYTLAGTNQAEREVFNYLASHSVDVIVNVIDASHLAHGLELTLELLELQRPVLVALNMMDEARRLGMHIDGKRLGELLGVATLPVIASRGQGIRDLFVAALQTARAGRPPKRQPFSQVVEGAIQDICRRLEDCTEPLPAQPLAIKLLEGDPLLQQQLGDCRPGLQAAIDEHQRLIQERRGQAAVWVISGERHMTAARLAQEVVEQGKRQITWRDKLDDVLLHPFWGYVALAVTLFLFFQFVYFFGNFFESPLLGLFESLEIQMRARLHDSPFWSEILTGLIQGVSGGVAIVLPYLLPFLFGLGLLEDVGYLPRVAFQMDALMHRLGLHGKAIVPFILGYGCNVPAIMSTRIMEDDRDRFLAAALATLVPCAARLSVIFGLVAYYLGPNLALAIYFFNLLVIALTARILSQMMPEDTPGLILEMPVYRLPTPRTVFAKAWFRVREFVIEAWPVLIIGSIILALLNYFNLAGIFNTLVLPLTWLLGLPMAVGVPLIFGVLRKELSMVMLRQALGTTFIPAALSAVQMVTFAVFVMFYIPCLATLVVIRRELGLRSMLIITALTVVIATLAALLARFAGLLVL